MAHPRTPKNATHTPTPRADYMPHTRLSDQFDKYCRARGLFTDQAIADFLGVAAITVGRIRRGVRGPGGDFIAAAVLAFKPYDIDFNDLFIAENDDDKSEPAA